MCVGGREERGLALSRATQFRVGYFGLNHRNTHLAPPAPSAFSPSSFSSLQPSSNLCHSGHDDSCRNGRCYQATRNISTLAWRREGGWSGTHLSANGGWKGLGSWEHLWRSACRVTEALCLCDSLFVCVLVGRGDWRQRLSFSLLKNPSTCWNVFILWPFS